MNRKHFLIKTHKHRYFFLHKKFSKTKKTITPSHSKEKET